jgi:hypothetical protein
MTVIDEPFTDGNVQFRVDMDRKRAYISKVVLVIIWMSRNMSIVKKL